MCDNPAAQLRNAGGNRFVAVGIQAARSIL